MLALCKRVMNLEPAARDCVVERYDGIDLDALILTHARTWYSRLLIEAPATLLPTDDIKDLITLVDCGQGVVRAHLPECCVRPLEVQLQHWEHSVTTFASPQDGLAQLQLNPWTRGTTLWQSITAATSCCTRCHWDKRLYSYRHDVWCTGRTGSASITRQ